MIPYGHQTIGVKDIQAVVSALKSDWLTQGPDVERFEKALAKYCGTRFALAVSNGTAALHLAYLAAGIQPGDEVVTSPNTFVATANMLLLCGATPVFGDIRPDTYNIDESKILKLINKKTKAIVPVHFAGHPSEMETIYQIARRYKLVVIEDACQALGSQYKNRMVGSLSSALTIFSFHPVKTITTAEGGAVVTNNEHYYKTMKLLRSHGVSKNKKGFNVMTQLGYNYRMNDLQAALGVSQLSRIDEFLKKRRLVASWYQQELKNVKQIILPTQLNHVKSSWHLYVIRTRKIADRLPLMDHLRSLGIGVNFHHAVVYSHPYYRGLGYNSQGMKVAQQYHKTAITIPCYPTLNRNQIIKISNSIKKYFNNAS